MKGQRVAKKDRRKIWLRLVGLGLLAVLLWQVDVEQLLEIIRSVSASLLVVATLLNAPMVGFKAFRWRRLLAAQQIRYGLKSSFLAYFGSIFVGFLTPGRLGEFVKAVHVRRDCEVTIGTSMSSVLADRLFDLGAILAVGSLAILSLTAGRKFDALLGVGLLAALFIGGLFILTHVDLADFFRKWSGEEGLRAWAKKGAEAVSQMQEGFRQLSLRNVMEATILTAGAYLIFFGQCYLLARALGLEIGFVTISFAAALGSIVTLLPISVSGLGTREAAIIAYLSTASVAAEEALSLALLIFVNFYLAGGLMGAVAWWIKPAPLGEAHPRAKSE